MTDGTVLDFVVRALRLTDGDVVVVEPQVPLTEPAIRALRKTFDVVAQRPELRRVTFLVIEPGLELERLTKEQRADLRRALDAADEAGRSR